MEKFPLSVVIRGTLDKKLGYFLTTYNTSVNIVQPRIFMCTFWSLLFEQREIFESVESFVREIILEELCRI